MGNIIATMQRRRILFLISLPQTPEFEKDKDDVNECINELRELQVDVREHIKPEDLAEANSYDIVIVVAHHDCDSDDLVLADGTMKMTDFVNSLPSDFSGILDFASCYSAMAYGAIKNHCPQCKVQAALVEIRLLQRIIMYPSLIECLYDDTKKDYHEAYEEVSKAFDEDAETYAVKQDEPKMTQLGQQMSSIYSPSEVKRDYPFQILVFFHYDSDKNVVKIKAKGRQTDSIIRDDFEIPIEMKEGDNISLSLSFDSTDNANIKVTNGEKKEITLKKVMVIECFKVTVLKDFSGNGFLADIEMSKDDESFVRCAFNIGVTENVNIAPAEILADIPLEAKKTEDLLSKYHDVFFSSLFDKEYVDGFKAILKNKDISDGTKVLEARNNLFNKNQLLLNQIRSIVNNMIDSIDDKGYDLLGRIKKKYKELRKDASRIDGDFKNIIFDGKEMVQFNNIKLDIFIPIEHDFLELSSNIIYLDKQMALLNKINELRRLIRIGDKVDKTQIKNRAYEFWTLIDEDGVDKALFRIFMEKSRTKSLISKGKVPAPYLTLLIAMSSLRYESVKNSQEDWKISTDIFIGETSVPTKDRVNEVMALLNKEEVIKYIDDYQNKCPTISISAYYLRKINVSIL